MPHLPRPLGSHHVLGRAAAATLLVASLGACGDDGLLAPGGLAGSYTATTFLATPTGQSQIDVLARGGSLTLTIASDGTTGGTLVLPTSVTGGAPLTASMAGAALQAGSTVKLQQTADTFVRDLTWSVVGNSLQVADQTAGGGRFTITLTKQ